MTSLTVTEIKIVFFALIFISVLGTFTALYYQDPIPAQTYSGTTTATNETSVSSDTWISGLIGTLPSPFDDPIVLLITGIIIVPIVIMLSYISIRAIKDLVSQWV